MQDKKDELLAMIQEGEHLRQDFKYFINDSRKISKSLSAFANTAGGRLLIGVKDNGSIVGVKTEEEYYMIEAAAQLYMKPEVKFTTQIYNYEGKKVLEVSILESQHKPHFVLTRTGKQEAYLRIADENILAPPVLIKIWEKENSQHDRIVRYTSDEEMVFSYLNEHANITEKQLMRFGKIGRNQAIETLSNLVIFKLLSFEYSSDGFSFTDRK